MDGSAVGGAKGSILRNIYRIQPNRYDAALKMYNEQGEKLVVSVVQHEKSSVYTIKSTSVVNQNFVVKITEGKHAPLARDKLNRFSIKCSCEDFSFRALRSCKHGLYAMILKLYK